MILLQISGWTEALPDYQPRLLQIRLGQLLASAVLLSTDNEHGTDYVQHFIQQNYRYKLTSRSFRGQLKAHLFQH